MRITAPTGGHFAALALALALLLSGTAHAELYKCRQPDGRTVYQQTACGGHADAETFAVDIRGPDGTETGASGKDYSIGTQAASMRAERQALNRARMRARMQAEAAAKRTAAGSGKKPEPDRAKCAKHRGEVAKWKQKLLQGYRKRSEKEHDQSKLAYHEALVDRYCP